MASASHSFVSRPNVITGKQEWVFVSEDYDFEQEIARSAYGDMLHDTDRNKKYFAALFKVITSLKQQNRNVHVLDIGTGTGLLSMMAVKCGADSVTACEAFLPVAECASKVILRNQMSEKIHLINKRSTDLTRDDLPELANVLVAEVFDTELIGEGALHTFKHAAENLLTPDAIVIPFAARMFVQIAESEHLWSHNRLLSHRLSNGVALHIPSDCTTCSGCPAVYDMQISELDRSDFTLLTHPIEVKRFLFSPPASQIPMRDSKTITTHVNKSGKAQVVFMWWTLEMEPENEVSLTCAPKWAFDNPSDYNWRDHWMQAVYFPTRSVSVKENQELILQFNHDEYSLWFDFASHNCPFPVGDHLNENESRLVRPVCSCGLHIAMSKTRIALLNSEEYRHRANLVVNAVSSNTLHNPVVVLSDGSLYSWLLASKNIPSFHVDQNTLTRRFIDLLIKSNSDVMASKVALVSSLEELNSNLSQISDPIEAIISEPFFATSLLPWHNLHFWYALDQIAPFLAQNVFISPLSCSLKAVLVEFEDLWQIRSHVNICEGFDISPFDDMIEKNSLLSDNLVEPHPLWEYPGKLLSDANLVCHWSFNQSVSALPETKIDTVMLPVGCSGKVNGIVLWCEWELLPGVWYSTGLTETSSNTAGSKPSWNRLCHQGVHLICVPWEANAGCQIEIQSEFKRDFGELSFTFSCMR